MIRTPIAVSVCVLAVGCGSSGPAAFNPDNISADMSESEIAFSTNGSTAVFAIDAEQRTEGFTTATNEDGRVFLFQNEDSAAALLDLGSDNITPFYAQLTDTYERPTGDAEARAQYAGVAYNGDDFRTTEIQGSVVITADFEENELSGTITDRTGYIAGLPFLFTLTSDIALGISPIDAAGRFGGNATLVIDEEAVGSGNYEGVYIGIEGDAVVGQVIVESDLETLAPTGTGPYIERGVFATE